MSKKILILVAFLAGTSLMGLAVLGSTMLSVSAEETPLQTYFELYPSGDTSGGTDPANLQAMVDAAPEGSTIQLKEGTFYFGDWGAVYISSKSLTLLGETNGANSVEDMVWKTRIVGGFIPLQFFNGSDLNVSGIWFDRNNLAGLAVGGWMGGWDDGGKITNNKFTDPNPMVFDFVDGPLDCSQGLYVVDPSLFGVPGEVTGEWLIANNYVDNSALAGKVMPAGTLRNYTGIWVASTEYASFLIRNNVVANFSGSGIKDEWGSDPNGSEFVEIRNNNIHLVSTDNRENGIDVWSEIDHVVRNNKIAMTGPDHRGVGISLSNRGGYLSEDGDDVHTVTNNNITMESGTAGIRLNRWARGDLGSASLVNAVVSNNVIAGTADYALQVGNWGASNNTIEGNIVERFTPSPDVNEWQPPHAKLYLAGRALENMVSGDFGGDVLDLPEDDTVYDKNGNVLYENCGSAGYGLDGEPLYYSGPRTKTNVDDYWYYMLPDDCTQKAPKGNEVEFQLNTASFTVENGSNARLRDMWDQVKKMKGYVSR